jgi:hypothetical protein
MLFADLADERWLSTKPGRGMLIALTAPIEFLGLDLISLVAQDHLLLSGGEASEVLLLLVDVREVVISSVCGGAK